MDKLDKVTIISVCALMTVLFGLIQISVWPLNKRMDNLENKIDRIEVKLENKIDGVEDKLDQVLFELKGHVHKPSKQANR